MIEIFKQWSLVESGFCRDLGSGTFVVGGRSVFVPRDEPMGEHSECRVLAALLEVLAGEGVGQDCVYTPHTREWEIELTRVWPRPARAHSLASSLVKALLVARIALLTNDRETQ